MPTAQTAMPRAFVALDFETANHKPDSACAIGLVRVEDDQVVATESRLIRPPSRWFAFTDIHGITWEMVKSQPSFAEVWHDVQGILDGALFIAAHNAGFDRGVLRACLEGAGLPPPKLPFVCTMHMARRVLGIYPTGLSVVAQRLKVPLNHHDALSDANACAHIVIAARKLREDAHRTSVMAPLALQSPA